jgi:ABC-type Zn2+ transport system substrate-binding protein/surface adhesin
MMLDSDPANICLQGLVELSWTLQSTVNARTLTSLLTIIHTRIYTHKHAHTTKIYTHTHTHTYQYTHVWYTPTNTKNQHTHR